MNVPHTGMLSDAWMTDDEISMEEIEATYTGVVKQKFEDGELKKVTIFNEDGEKISEINAHSL